MEEHGIDPLLIAGVGVILALAGKALARRSHIPALVMYLAIGAGLQLYGKHLGTIGSRGEAGIEFLAEIGLALLLFRVGLESDIKTLRLELPRAAAIWAGNVLCSAGLGFAASYWLLEQSLTTSLFVGAALSATSVALSVSVWEEAGKLATRQCQKLIDVAELDDISAVLVMSVLLAIAPELESSTGSEDMIAIIGQPIAEVGLSLLVFLLLLAMFFRYVESPLTRWLFAVERDTDAMLSIAAVGLCIAVVADALGLSIAIGALSSGMLFSGDHHARSAADRFLPIVNLFTPFFFIGIGYAIPLGGAQDSLWFGLVLSLAAVAGKIIGGTGVALFQDDRRDAITMGISLVPRAEIAMVIAFQGQRVAPTAVTQEIFAALAIVCIVTSVAAPIALRRLIFDEPTTTRISAHQRTRKTP